MPTILQNALLMGNSKSASLDLNFLQGVDSRLTTTRSAGGATYFDSNGTLQLASANQARTDYGTTMTGTTNWSVNNQYAGFVAADGVERASNGTFATNPLNASQNTAQNGWSWLVVGAATVTWDGISSVTLTGDGTNKAEIDTNAALTTIVGMNYTVSVDVSGSVCTARAGTTLSGTNLGTQAMTVGTSRIFGFTATTTTTFLGFSNTAASASTITNASVKSAGITPTNVLFSNTGSLGLARTLNSLVTVSGIRMVQVTWTGTATSTGTITLVQGSNVSAAIGQTWTGSFYAQLVSGAFPRPIVYEIDELTSAGSFLAGSQTNNTPTTTLTRFSGTRTLNQPTVGLTRLNGMNLQITSGDVINLTYNVGGGQLELAASASTLIQTNALPVNNGAIPLGLLIEESRTNGIRNPRSEGGTVSDAVEQVTNGTFTLNPINASQNTLQNGWQWQLVGAGSGTVVWTGSTAVTIAGDGTIRSELDTSITTVNGTSYNLYFDCTAQVSNLTIGTSVGGSSIFVGNTGTTTGQSLTFTATSTTTWIGFGRVSAGGAVIDNVSVKKAGIVPSNYTVTNAAGLAVTVAAISVEQGIPYVDLAFAGIATGTQITVVNENFGQIAAANSSVWTHSAYLRSTGSVLTNVATVELDMQTANAGLSTLSTYTGSTTALSTSSLGSQRLNAVFTVADATVASVRPRISVNLTATAFTSFTIRIGAPQLELGGFQTSPILPVIGTPLATTRAADIITMPVGAWFNASVFSAVVEANLPQAAPAGSSAGLLLFDDGTSNNRVALRELAGATTIGALYLNSTVAVAQPTATGTITPGTAFKAGFVALPASLACSLNGAAPVSAAGALPVGLTTMRLGQNAIGIQLANGYIRRVRYFTRALPDAELINLTT